MLKRLEALQKFLQSLNSLRKQGLIKTVDEAVAFAKQEFGEVNDLFKRQIEQIFKGTTPKAPPPGGGGITSIKNAPKKETPPQESGISFSIPERGIIRQKASIEEITDMIKNNPYRPKKGLDPVEGMTRTAARVVLDRYGIKVPERVDPIEAFEENFGGDALMDLKDVGEELLEKETRGRITESMGEFLESRGMFNLKINKDAPKGMTDDELIKKLTGEVDEAYGVTPKMKKKLDREEVKKEAMEKYGFTEEEFENIMNTEFDEKILDDVDKAIEQEDILLKFDPKGRKPNAMGGFQRTGFAEGPEDPKKKKGVMQVLKKVPKLGKLVGGLETIMNKFGPDAIGTLEDFYKKGKLKLDPNVKQFQDDKKAVFDFNMRQLNKTEADANKEMDDIIKDQIEGGFLRDMEKSMQRDMQRELRKPEREILDVTPVPKGFKLSKEKFLKNFPEISEEFADEVIKLDRDTQGRIIEMLENRRLDPEAYDRLLDQFGDTLEFQKEFDKYIRRKKNAEGGLNYLMGM